MHKFDSYDNSIVIDGWEEGVADSPYEGISNLQNVNIASIPGEVAVAFSTVNTASYGTIVTLGSVTSVMSNAFAVNGATTLETGMAITFTSIGSYTGISNGTAAYWVRTTAGTTAFFIVAAPQNAASGTVVTVGGSGTANFTVYTPAEPKYFAQGNTLGATSFNQYMLDANGNVWSNKYATPSGQWIFIGNSVKNQGTGTTSNGIAGHTTNDQSEGNGLVYFNSSNNNGYLFVFSSSSVDYLLDNAAGNSWSYGWSPSAGTINNSTAQFTMGLGEVTNTSHEAFYAPDGNVYFCDWWNIRKFFQADKITPVAFDPLVLSSYTYQTFGLLPIGDYSQCMAAMGVNLLIGGSRNFVYQWDTTSNVITYPIYLPEANVVKVIAVDLNGYIFAGNRGRIYITNGSQAQLYKKIPDHISGTIEPYFTWGGVASNKNQLYFSAYTQDNSGTSESKYGGLWAINLQTKALRLTNQLSYGSYAGFASALLALSGIVSGFGLIIGWNQTPLSGGVRSTANGGIDKTTGNPYTTSISIIDSDLIAIGTFEKPRDFQRIEYLLTMPLVSGESINLQSRTDFSQTFASIGTDTVVGNYTNAWPVNFKQAKWIQIRATLNSTITSPSYVRLKQIRMTGLVGPTLASSQQLSA